MKGFVWANAALFVAASFTLAGTKGPKRSPLLLLSDGQNNNIIVQRLDRALKKKDALALLEAVRSAKEAECSDLAVPVLVAGLRNKDKIIRWYAARSLSRLGPEARPATSALEQTLLDSDTLVRLAAADALSEITPIFQASHTTVLNQSRD